MIETRKFISDIGRNVIRGIFLKKIVSKSSRNWLGFVLIKLRIRILLKKLERNK